ncbi:2-succinyl-5-enolpyruvyl-6-hydroxy-3-cyclohexene-1-carboxylic-acid synthase [Halorussus gelatinilyticus]|uniref:2-succinyl-5-enolpyruvyl-6-hydroxy-3-cyclohexene-1-carboxylate synthase n=1 Tax=Halorussus gelatinilyticus TaxID=2937524 RepID=A0A8U0IFK6_9EURY|nr:2-succinyl-5-enolpyruvyl-6-hydroxy-3-cyclohexene-1-carboxylic-acid synthase [Halorussus gelatinilyticus]UPV99859.1 2-succinyl-5-enolpyruvyl-6-hydroxy-3-cyclohexene-1-carboxylic-acid synthase [Halorussus gelatinilyticus]
MSDSPAPNRNTLWARTLVEELDAAGVEAVCIAPGSRSTPLTVAFAEHPEIRVFSHLDERSAAFFALGRAKRTGKPTPLVCTSGTAAANFHPAVIEASQSRVPMLVLTADRPPELRDSGANQTIDQQKLYGDSVRWYADLPEPEPEGRKLRSLRTTAARALSESTGTPPGPVHLNVPFRKPLEPVEVPGDVPESLADEAPLGAAGRTESDGSRRPFVRTAQGRPELAESEMEAVREAVESADRGLLVAGPADAPSPEREALADFAAATGFPILADPLSGHRFGHAGETPVLGGYDGYLESVGESWPDPDLVVRFGASPTSKVLRRYLEASDARQFLVDPAGGWREATFTATDLLAADPTRFARRIASGLDSSGSEGSGSDESGGESPETASWRERFAAAEEDYWRVVESAREERLFEGGVLSAVAEDAPDPATVMVSNSMPVRDLDRFGRPRAADLTVLGNRGASGIDGITSTGLGAGSATDDPLVLVTGDLAYYHDMNGLLAVARCGVDATVVEINNDGGGIFHMLPIEEFDPPFTEQFRTPHGLDYEPTGDLYGLDFERVADLESFRSAFEASVESAGTQVIEVATDAERSHRFREEVGDRVAERLE